VHRKAFRGEGDGRMENKSIATKLNELIFVKVEDYSDLFVQVFHYEIIDSRSTNTGQKEC
jgi:hypothetical protein